MTISELEDEYPDALVNVEVEAEGEEEEFSDFNQALILLNDAMNFLGYIRMIDRSKSFLNRRSWNDLCNLQNDIAVYSSQWDVPDKELKQ